MLHILIISVIMTSALVNSVHAKCDSSDPRLAKHIISITKKWEVLSKRLAATKLVGKEVERGTCAVTLLRLGAPAPFALAPHESVKDVHEAISCLALEKWQLQQECKCHDGGLKFSREDETVERATTLAYKDIQSISAKATKIGIPNKTIRSLVERANEIKFCFDMNTVSLMNNIKRDIQKIVEMEPTPRH